MKHKTIMLWLTGLLLCWHFSANASVLATVQTNDNVKVTWDAQCIIEWAGGKDSWDGHFYKVKYRRVGDLFWSDPKYTSGTNYTYASSEFEVGETYKVRVRYYGKRPGCRGMVRSRLLGDDEFTYQPKGVLNPPQGDLSEYVRIKSVSFGRCMYPYTASGLAGLRMHNWVCWNDPYMAFTVIATAAPDEVRLQSATTGLCIKPMNSVNYHPVTMGSCAASDTLFDIQDMGGDQFRLRNVSNNMCLYGSPDDGGFIRQFGCWNNPDMLFEFEEY
ncbi:RICIN domain-containing protein [Marinicella sp. S1101]|uniref:RICIN domain-containing protein n=1 Tax=Marinicella marina TaxID=2996016 RepID=UPI00226090A1|nr:RICIN domain-containing protein [Marinicella marina]MCX7552282.1 RICIN domain-containing protein [Marinicella marina]MDJ1139158.1 RICIN domain-containing protein [Marinicella marina]